MRGWRVTLAKQAGVGVDDVAVVKTEKPRAQRGGGKSMVILTYEFRVVASDPCVSPEAPSFPIPVRNPTALRGVRFWLTVLRACARVCVRVLHGCSGSCCGRC
jgi:hypothetical protein